MGGSELKSCKMTLLIVDVLDYFSEARSGGRDIDEYNDIQSPSCQASVVLSVTVCKRTAPRQDRRC